MSINVVLPSSDFNDNTVTFTSGSPGQIKLVGPGEIITTGESVEGVSGLCLTILVRVLYCFTWHPQETRNIYWPTSSHDLAL